MRRIKIRRKPKRKLRIKRRRAPHRIAGSRARVRKLKLKRRKSLPKVTRTLRIKRRKGRKIVVRRRRRSASRRHGVNRRKQSTRDIYVFGPEGYQLVPDASPRQAKLSSRHLIAIARFLGRDDAEFLKPFRGKRIRGIELLTDPKRIREFADADLVKLDGLYRDQRGNGRRK